MEMRICDGEGLKICMVMNGEYINCSIVYLITEMESSVINVAWRFLDTLDVFVRDTGFSKWVKLVN